jgi:hypothetical protein
MSDGTVGHLQPVAGPFDLTAVVKRCDQMDAETLGLYFEQNWKMASGNTLAMAYLMCEMKRKFKLRDRHKQANGEYVRICGFTSFEKWFQHATGKSARMAYYALQTEAKKHKRNKIRRSERSVDFLKRNDFPVETMERFEKAAQLSGVTLKDWAGEILRTAVKNKK